MKRCCCCRRDLLTDAVNSMCEKCKKYHAKYGKPTICSYCQLPAAFFDKKCVHCSYSERKFGAPRECSNCHLKSAFPRDTKPSSKPLLCRLCLMVLDPSSSHAHKRASTSSASSSKKHRSDSSHHKHRGNKSPLNTMGSQPNTSKSTLSTSFMMGLTAGPAEEDQANNIQQLREKINELNNLVVERSKQARERQDQIAMLEAEMLQRDKEYRQKLQNSQKQYNSTVDNLQDHIRQLQRELANKKKV